MDDELSLLLGMPSSGDAVLENYLTHVANAGLLPYKAVLQYGGKHGEPLYQHILKGIFFLHSIAGLLDLSEEERRVLFTAFTLHDLNKAPLDETGVRRYVELSTLEQIKQYLSALQLDLFFEGYEAYLLDIQMLIQRHGAHTPTGTAHRRATTPYKLPRERLELLLKLMQAADKSGMVHGPNDTSQLESVLHHLNSVSPTRYRTVFHQLGEQRGSFTNLIHNAVMEEFATLGLTPLLCYPDGVVYLVPAAQEPLPALDDARLAAIAQRVARAINVITGEKYTQFIKAGNMGISVGDECLNLGIPMEEIVGTIAGILERRPYKSEDLTKLREDSVRRTTAALTRADPALVPAVQDLLATGAVPDTPSGMRAAELLRTYYIFLKEHLSATLPDPWQHLYAMLNLPPAQQALVSVFDARMDRASAIAVLQGLRVEPLMQRIVQDAQPLLDARGQRDPRVPDLVAYLRLMFSFTSHPVEPSVYRAALASYVAQQHKQCSQCSLPFETQPLMSGDVRDGLKVQFFSNRLRGGSSEPKRNICPICQMQLLIEKLNYPDRGGENVFYLHCFPYGSVPPTLVAALAAGFAAANQQNTLGGALRIPHPERPLRELVDVLATASKSLPQPQHNLAAIFSATTRQGKAQPFGIAIPRYSSTRGAVFTLPVNTPVERGESTNETAQFLFALTHAVIIQQYLGCRLLLSRSAIPTIPAEAMSDLYVDAIPVAARGLLATPQLATYVGDTDQPSTLPALWRRLNLLYQIRIQIGDLRKGDEELAALVRALAEHPLTIWHVAERIATRAENDESRRTTRLVRTAALIEELVTDILEERKDTRMQALSTHLQELARIAWKGGLRGRSLKKNSLLTSITEAFDKLAQVHPGSPLDRNLLQAAAATDLAQHVERVRKQDNRGAGEKLWNSSSEFMDYFFTNIYIEAYQERLARLLADRKIILSAFYLYMLNELAEAKARKREHELSDLDETELGND